MVEWSRTLDVRLSEWCCSVSMVWVQIPSREEQNLTALKSNSYTVWFNFQTYIYIYICTTTDMCNGGCSRCFRLSSCSSCFVKIVITTVHYKDMVKFDIQSNMY